MGKVRWPKFPQCQRRRIFVKKTNYLHIMIFGACGNVICVTRSIPCSHSHHCSLMTTRQLSNARKHSQVPESHFVTCCCVEIARCSHLEGGNWRFSGRNGCECCDARKSHAWWAKRFNGTDIWLPEVPSSDEGARGWEKNLWGFIVLDAYNWARMGWQANERVNGASFMRSTKRDGHLPMRSGSSSQIPNFTCSVSGCSEKHRIRCLNGQHRIAVSINDVSAY